MPRRTASAARRGLTRAAMRGCRRDLTVRRRHCAPGPLGRVLTGPHLLRAGRPVRQKAQHAEGIGAGRTASRTARPRGRAPGATDSSAPQPVGYWVATSPLVQMPKPILHAVADTSASREFVAAELRPIVSLPARLPV